MFLICSRGRGEGGKRREREVMTGNQCVKLCFVLLEDVEGKMKVNESKHLAHMKDSKPYLLILSGVFSHDSCK